MEEFLNTNATAVFTLLTSILTLLIGFVFTLISQSIKDKKELKQKEIEQKNKISEITYQKLFEKKIEVYTKLHFMLYNNEKELVNVGFIDYDYNEFQGQIETEITKEQIRISLLRVLDEYIKENIFYVSTELEKELLKLTSALNRDDKLFHWEISEGELDLSKLSEEEFKNNRLFYEKHKLKIENLLALIEKETKLIKEKIEFN